MTVMELLAEIHHYLSVVLMKEQLSPLGSCFRSLFVNKLSVVVSPSPCCSVQDLLRISLESKCPVEIVQHFWSQPVSKLDINYAHRTPEAEPEMTVLRDVEVIVPISDSETSITILPDVSAQFLEALIDDQEDDDREIEEIENGENPDDIDVHESESLNSRASVEATGKNDDVEEGIHDVSKSKNSQGKESSEPDVFYVCRTCGKRFDKKKSLLTHMYTHNKKYDCPYCEKTFAHSTNMKRHVITHTGNRDFSCSLCDKKFATKCQQQIHIRTHAKNALFNCRVCDKRFTSKSGLKKHLSDHVLEGDNCDKINLPAKKTSSCSYCNCVFQSSDHLEHHLLACLHGKVNGDCNTTVFSCNMCPEQFINEILLKAHVMKCHPAPKVFKCTVCDKSMTSSKALEYHMFSHSGDPDGGKAFCCHVCGKRFRFSSHMKEHLIIHTGQRPFACTVCEQSFAHRNTLKNHMMTHGLGEAKCHICERCGQLFAKPFFLKRHIAAVHDSETPFTCSVCQKTFKLETYLKQHEKTHAPRNSIHKCDLCSKVFLRRSSLVVHMRLHAGERPFPCEFCSRVFAGAAGRRTHVRFVHEKVKPFSCPLCPYKCRDKNNLNKHIRIHTGEKPFECRHCSKRFSTSSSLNTHIKTHSGEKPHSCPACNYSCIQMPDLRKHMAKKHALKL